MNSLPHQTRYQPGAFYFGKRLPFIFSYVIHFMDVKIEDCSYEAITSLPRIRLRSAGYGTETPSPGHRCYYVLRRHLLLCVTLHRRQSWEVIRKRTEMKERTARSGSLPSLPVLHLWDLHPHTTSSSWWVHTEPSCSKCCRKMRAATSSTDRKV